MSGPTRTKSLLRELASAFALALVVVLVAPSAPLAAEVIGTQDAIQAESRQARVDRVQELLGRDDVERAMVRLGVDPEDARLRVASLSDAELAELEGNLEQAPAGGEVLAFLGVLLIVLLVLDLTGVVRIFRRG
jgi:hypothetical protein